MTESAWKGLLGPSARNKAGTLACRLTSLVSRSKMRSCEVPAVLREGMLGTQHLQIGIQRPPKCILSPSTNKRGYRRRLREQDGRHPHPGEEMVFQEENSSCSRHGKPYLSRWMKHVPLASAPFPSKTSPLARLLWSSRLAYILVHTPENGPIRTRAQTTKKRALRLLPLPLSPKFPQLNFLAVLAAHAEGERRQAGWSPLHTCSTTVSCSQHNTAQYQESSMRGSTCTFVPVVNLPRLVLDGRPLILVFGARCQAVGWGRRNRLHSRGGLIICSTALWPPAKARCAKSHPAFSIIQVCCSSNARKKLESFAFCKRTLHTASKHAAEFA